MDYIDRNPVKAGLTCALEAWPDGEAFHIKNHMTEVVDYSDFVRLFYVRQALALPPP
jgi:hypothetical protein